MLKVFGLFHLLRDLRRDFRFAQRMRSARREWLESDRALPLPASRKHTIIRQVARAHACRVLVETGTFYGDTPFALRRHFDDIHSIELSPELHALARREMAHLPHLHFYHGDSSVLLPRIVPQLTSPTIFWLDGHYCSGPSARADRDTPIRDEILLLLRRPAGRDVVLIDDARLFTGANGYPTLEELRSLVLVHRPDATFAVADDIIRVIPV